MRFDKDNCPWILELLDSAYQPKETLLQIFHLLGMELAKPSLADIDVWAQEHLLRKKEDHWEEETSSFLPLKEDLLPLFQKLKVTEEIHPSLQSYQGALVHGGYVDQMALRFSSLFALWEKGVRFSHLYFLTGDRPLIPQKESLEELTRRSPILKMRSKQAVFPSTEYGMIQAAWDQLELPTGLDRVPFSLINAPKTQDAKTKEWKRPNTDDTIRYWLRTSPKLGDYLAITNAPYIARQDLVIKTLAPEGYCFETVGASMEGKGSLAALLDESARLIFQMRKFAHL